MIHHADCDLLVSTIAADRAAIREHAQAAGIPQHRIHYLFDAALDLVHDATIPQEITGA
jgi:hypothetical protein